MKKPDYFELAFLLAVTQTCHIEDEEERWSRFVDVLHRICDKFALALKVEKAKLSNDAEFQIQSYAN